MENKQIQVDCPCCASKLTIDVLTQTVMRADSPEERDELGHRVVPGERWDKAQRTVEDRSREAGDRLGDALDQERGKAGRLDDLFDKANEKLRKRENERDDFDF